MASQNSNFEYLDGQERIEAKKRSGESMNCMYLFQQEGTNCDVIIHTDDGGHFSTHSAILSRCSPYFLALFKTSLQQRKDFTIPGIDSTTMRLIIQYAYTREVPITPNNASDLMVDADQLGVQTLVDQCGQFMIKNLTVENCVEVYSFGRNYFFDKLRNSAFQYILKNFPLVSKRSNQLLQLTDDDLIDILNNDELNVRDEGVVWEMIVKWIDCDPKIREDKVVKMLRQVRLGLMDPLYFREKVKNHPYLKRREDEECRSIIIQTLIHLDKLDQTTDKIDQLPNICRPRLPHELLFAVGGWSGGNPTEMVETYDSRIDQWMQVYADESPGPRAYHGCVVIGPNLYVIGGFDGMEYFNGCWCYHVGAQCWKEIAPMHAQRCYVSVALLDGLIYAMGGYNGQHRQSSAEVYDPATNQWINIAPMHVQRSDADATSYNQKIYIVGGFNGQTCMNSAECYDPSTNRWTMLAPMRMQRSGVSCISYEGFIYAIGGFNGSMRLRSVEKYDIVRGTWVVVPDMINVRSNFGVEVLEDRLFVIGGFNGVTTVNEVECFDNRTNSWRACKRMNIVRSALAVCIVSGMENIYGYLEYNRNPTRARERRLSTESSSSSSSGMDRSVSE